MLAHSFESTSSTSSPEGEPLPSWSLPHSSELESGSELHLTKPEISLLEITTAGTHSYVKVPRINVGLDHQNPIRGRAQNRHDFYLEEMPDLRHQFNGKWSGWNKRQVISFHHDFLETDPKLLVFFTCSAFGERHILAVDNECQLFGNVYVCKVQLLLANDYEKGVEPIYHRLSFEKVPDELHTDEFVKQCVRKAAEAANLNNTNLARPWEV